MKLASIFFTASAVYVRNSLQRYKQTSEKYEVYFDIYHSECSVCSQFSAKLTKGLLSRTQKATKYYKSLYFSISRDYDTTLTLQILAIFA